MCTKSNNFLVHLELPFDTRSPLIKGLHSHSKVSLLRTRIEEDIGILAETYHLTYLDAAPLEDSRTLRSYDVINGATLKVCPWGNWSDLLIASYFGNATECFSCSMGITKDSEWSKHCAWCTLYIASHSGHCTLVANLLERTSVAINLQSRSGWTVLHAAARMGQWKVLCILVDNGADVRITNSMGLTAFDLARQYGHKKCEQSLNFCMWGLQKHRVVRERRYDYSARKAHTNATRQAHQYRDSTLTTWRRGTHGQMYMMQVPNPITVGDVVKFERESTKNAGQIRTGRGESRQTCVLPSIKLQPASPQTSGDVPRSPPPASITLSGTTDQEGQGRGKKLDFNYGWFDPLRSQLLIPPTHDVLTYANPSSCQLRPRSVLNPNGYQTPLHPFPVQRKL